jgi:hypothetical protein
MLSTQNVKPIQIKHPTVTIQESITNRCHWLCILAQESILVCHWLVVYITSYSTEQPTKAEGRIGI